MKAYFIKLFNNFKESKLKVKLIVFFGILIYTLLLVFTLVKVNYNITTPAGLSPTSSYVQVEEGYNTGNIFTVAVYNSKRISLLQKFLASKNYQVDVYVPDIILSDKEETKQGKIMKDVSINNALIVAYQEAQKTNPDIKIEYEFGMAVYSTSQYTTNDLKVDDVITKINDEKVTKDNYSEILSNIDIDDSCLVNPTPIKLEIIRNNKKQEITVYKSFDNGSCKIGITSYSLYKIVEPTYPKYEIQKNNTLGPSGGLMQALGIYNSLTKEDITKGLVIAGTGTIDVDGLVGEIGGVQQKVYSAYTRKVDVFFVPEANYQEAKEMYDRLRKPTFELKMVKTFEEALDYLKNKEAK